MSFKMIFEATNKPVAYEDKARLFRVTGFLAICRMEARVAVPEVTEATDEWADSLIGAGANVLRINAAHDSPREWRQTIGTFRGRARTVNRIYLEKRPN